MNSIQSIDSGKGLLKQSYDPISHESPISAALKKRIKSMKLKTQSKDEAVEDLQNEET